MGKKTRNAPPYFPFWERDFVHAIRCADMTDAEVGQLVMVMCQQWENQGPLDLDPRKFAAFTGWDPRKCSHGLARLEALGKIERTENGIFTGRQAEEIAKYKAKVQAAEEREAKRRSSNDRQRDRGEVTAEVAPMSDQSPADLSGNDSDINAASTREAALPDTRHQTPEREEGNTPPPPEGGVRAKSKSKRKSGAKPKTDPLLVQQAYEAYCAKARQIGKREPVLTPELRAKIGARLADYGIAGWMWALDQIERSHFLMGEKGDAPFTLTLAMFVRPSNFGKIHDGGFDSGRKPKPRPADVADLKPAAWRGPLQRLIAERRDWNTQLPSPPPHSSGYCVPQEIHDELDLGSYYAADGSGRFVGKHPRMALPAPLAPLARVNGHTNLNSENRRLHS